MPLDSRFPPRPPGLVCVVAVAVGAAAFAVLNPSVAEARDSDGTRLGAQEQKVDSEERDALDPPEDESDWRYVKIGTAQTIEFRLDSKSEDADVTLRLTEATGDEIKSVTTSGGSTTVEEDLSPGVYYFEVKSSDAVEYTISLD